MNDPAKPQAESLFSLVFTRPGCRTELRLGALLVLAGTFLWNFVGPTMAIKIALAGIPLVLIGTVLQALGIGSKRGFPWKLGLSMLILGGAMCYDFRYRDVPGGPLLLVLVGPILASAGLWITLWWPIATLTQRRAALETAS
ncbi:MAG: hypothetical protein AAB263_06845 [Planctomycetota bacterium]